MCAGGARDARGSGGSPPPRFGCPSQEGAFVCASRVRVRMPAHSLTLTALPGNTFSGEGATVHLSQLSLATSLAAGNMRRKPLKIVDSPLYSKRKAAACSG